MSAWSGLFVGALTLGALEALVSAQDPGNVTGLFQIPGAVARWWVSPDTPLIPDLRSSNTKALETALQAAYNGVAKMQPAVYQTSSPTTTTATTPNPNLPPTPSTPRTLSV